MEFIRKILNKETCSYLFFGICTTIINYFTFIVFYNGLFKEAPLIANTVAFIAATLFAYITNKIFVFKSYNWKLKALVPEVFSFVSARVLSFLFEQMGLFIYVEYLLIDNLTLIGIDSVMIVKIIS
ncbi:MAG: GtrA family protein [Clostridium sp.]